MPRCGNPASLGISLMVPDLRAFFELRNFLLDFPARLTRRNSILSVCNSPEILSSPNFHRSGAPFPPRVLNFQNLLYPLCPPAPTPTPPRLRLDSLGAPTLPSRISLSQVLQINLPAFTSKRLLFLLLAGVPPTSSGRFPGVGPPSSFFPTRPPPVFLPRDPWVFCGPVQLPVVPLADHPSLPPVRRDHFASQSPPHKEPPLNLSPRHSDSFVIPSGGTVPEIFGSPAHHIPPPF